MSPPPAASTHRMPLPVADSPELLLATVEAFLRQHADGVVLEEGKTLFELQSAQYTVSLEQGRCMLQLWDSERQLVRTVVAAEDRKGTLRLGTQRFGQSRPGSMLVLPSAPRREPNRRDAPRQAYLRLLERVLVREYPEWRAEGFRAAMDLERSFGPAYARGTMVRGREAWAVIGVGAAESQAIVDGVLTLGVLWLHHCRERGDGKLLYKGLRLVVPAGAGLLTLARLPWMNQSAAQWELLELDEPAELLNLRDPRDQGNLRTRLVQHPDPAAALERFKPAIEKLMALLPAGGHRRVEQRLRSSTELAFSLHGMEFARVRLRPAPGSFAHDLELSVGVGSAETPLDAVAEADVRHLIEDLFSRRQALPLAAARSATVRGPARGIGAVTGRPAHQRTPQGLGKESESGLGRLHRREQAMASQHDPLFRAMPERWLESVLRENLAPLTRSLGPRPLNLNSQAGDFANDPDPDTLGNRKETVHGWAGENSGSRRQPVTDRLIPRFDPRFVYTQVPAIAGAGDRGMLDLLGMTQDGRLAVIEIKAADDLQLALQGLDYWVRVRHHHASSVDPATGHAASENDLQRHGYFRGVELSPLPPRLYLVAPALHVHPATETVLRYLSPRVEWTLLALDERWRQEVRVVWRRTGGQPPREASAQGWRTRMT